MDDFNFYLKFAKPLVLNLPDAKDRAIAAQWVKKLRDLQSDGPEADMRTEYLKLLLFVMQRNKLAGIFEKAPPEGPLQGFPSNYKATDMLSLVKPRRAALPVYPPVFTSVGGDLCQFVAVQEIPDFGLHGYFAISTEPLSKWSHASTNTAKKAIMKPEHYVDCFKNTCMLVESSCQKKSSEPDPLSSPASQSPASQQQQPEGSAQNAQAPVSSKNTESSGNTRQLNECERERERITRPATKFVPLPPIPFQTFRKEIAGFESRPSWGRSHYIERLIDESPHLAADLDVSQADAMFNVMTDKTFKKAENYGPCAISNNRQRTERMLDLPPCAVEPRDIKPDLRPLYTCCPKREEFIETHTDICLSERDFYPCGKRSGLSLRGGSDKPDCCSSPNKMNRSRASSDNRENNGSPRQYYTPESSRHRPRNQANRDGFIISDTDDPLDVDTSIHNTTTASKYINPNTSGNFKWLEDLEYITLSDPIEMSFEESQPNSRIPKTSEVIAFRMNNIGQEPPPSGCNDKYNVFGCLRDLTIGLPASSEWVARNHTVHASKCCTLETAECSELDDEPPINQELQPENLMPQIARRMQTSKVDHLQRSSSLSQQSPSCYLNNRSHDHDDWEQQTGLRNRNNEIEPSMAVLRRRFAKSREVSKRNPEMYEKSYKWKEIIDQTEP